jgi:hypothetical protein
LEKVSWAGEENVYCAVAGWNTLLPSVSSISSVVSFSSRISWLIFCLDDLSVVDGGVLESPVTTVLGSICGF